MHLVSKYNIVVPVINEESDSETQSGIHVTYTNTLGKESTQGPSLPIRHLGRILIWILHLYFFHFNSIEIHEMQRYQPNSNFKKMKHFSIN